MIDSEIYMSDSPTSLSISQRAVSILPPTYTYAYPRLAILLVSTFIHEDSKRILHRCGTFAFDLWKTYGMLKQSTLKEIAYMQHVTIDVDFRSSLQISSYPRSSHWKIEAASEVISHFGAHSDSDMPRASCVVKIRLDGWGYMLFGSSGKAKQFHDALGSLTGFRYVEVRMTRVRARDPYPKYRILRIIELGKYLEGKLGRMEEGIEEGYFCMRYHPQRG